MSKYNGSCLCGKVSYEIEGESLGFYHCHCQRCRKASGTGHGSIIRIQTDGITWLSGEQLIHSYKVPDAERFRNDFCSNCGASLPRHFPKLNMLSLPAGTLDMEPDIKPEARIFLDSKADWSCQDEMPGFGEYPAV